MKNRVLGIGQDRAENRKICLRGSESFHHVEVPEHRELRITHRVPQRRPDHPARKRIAHAVQGCLDSGQRFRVQSHLGVGEVFVVEQCECSGRKVDRRA